MPGYDAGLTLLLLVDKYDIDSFIVESISYTLLVLFSIADGTRKLVNSVGTNTEDYRLYTFDTFGFLTIFDFWLLTILDKKKIRNQVDVGCIVVVASSFLGLSIIISL